MNKTLEELKKELRDGFGKITCWQWLCKERDATTEQAQVEVAEEVLAMPQMGNVAAAQAYRSRLEGRRTRDIRDILAGRYRASEKQEASTQATNQNGDRHTRTTLASQSEVPVMSHRIRSGYNLAHVTELCCLLIKQRRGKMLGDEILRHLDFGYISDDTYRRLSRWCHPRRSEPRVQPIAAELSRELFGCVISRMP
jgi:hypothetical protein